MPGYYYSNDSLDTYKKIYEKKDISLSKEFENFIEKMMSHLKKEYDSTLSQMVECIDITYEEIYEAFDNGSDPVDLVDIVMEESRRYRSAGRLISSLWGGMTPDEAPPGDPLPRHYKP